MCADTLRVAMIVPNVAAFSGGTERTMRLLEHGPSAGIEYTAFLPDGGAPNEAVARRLADLELSGRVSMAPLARGAANGSESYDAIAVPTEYWWGAWRRARDARLRGPPRIDVQLLPYLGSLDLLKCANVERPSLRHLLRVPLLQAERYAEGPLAAAVRTAACVATVRGMSRLRDRNVLAISSVLAGDLASIGYRGPVVVPECPNGIDRGPVQAALQEDLPIEYDAVYAARLHPQKGFLDLPAIVARWRRAGDVRVALCGAPDHPRYEARFRALARAHGVEDAFVRLESLPRDELYRTIRRSRMLLYPSYVDSFSLSVLESLSLGVPIVAYDTAAIATIWSDRSGVFRAPVGDADALARLAAAIRADGRLDAAREATARQAATLLDTYTWEKAVRDERKFYEAAGERD